MLFELKFLNNFFERIVMSYFKYLAIVAGGVGAVVLAPVTGGSSIALAIGAFGTTTAAGAAIGAGVGAAAAAAVYASSSNDDAREEGKKQGFEEGKKAGEKAAHEKYEQKMNKLTDRFQSYQNLESKIFAMYAMGLAMANADGNISKVEREELDAFVSGCLASSFPAHIKEEIAKLIKKPPSLEDALKFAHEAKLPKRDIDDIIDLIANADDEICESDKRFIAQWQSLSAQYENA
jgi:uncharacterized tellurite resistance protein B-like protein